MSLLRAIQPESDTSETDTFALAQSAKGKMDSRNHLMMISASQRPTDYEHLDSKAQWAIDKFLGCLDWNGNCGHLSNSICQECKDKYWTGRKGNVLIT